MQGTDEGYAKISTLNDVMDAIIKNPTINVFEYHRLATIASVFHVTLIDTYANRHYGTFLISEKAFDRLQKHFDTVVEFKESPA